MIERKISAFKSCLITKGIEKVGVHYLTPEGPQTLVFQTNEFFVINEKQLVCFAPNQLVYLILEQIKEGKYQLFSYIELYKNDKLIGDGARLLPVGRG